MLLKELDQYLTKPNNANLTFVDQFILRYRANKPCNQKLSIAELRLKAHVSRKTITKSLKKLQNQYILKKDITFHENFISFLKEIHAPTKFTPHEVFGFWCWTLSPLRRNGINPSVAQAMTLSYLVTLVGAKNITAKEIAQHFKANLRTAQNYLSWLITQSLVKRTRKGNHHYYALTNEFSERLKNCYNRFDRNPDYLLTKQQTEHFEEPKIPKRTQEETTYINVRSKAKSLKSTTGQFVNKFKRKRRALRNYSPDELLVLKKKAKDDPQIQTLIEQKRLKFDNFFDKFVVYNRNKGRELASPIKALVGFLKLERQCISNAKRPSV